MMVDLNKAIAFAHAKGVPLSRRKKMVDAYGSIEAACARIAADRCDPADAEAARVLKPQLTRPMGAVVRRLERLGAWAVAYGTPAYPRALAAIEDPPMLLYGRGRWPLDPARFVGFVGPREPSQYGARVAQWLAADLVAEGLTIVSGLARGIDAIGHEAAARAGKPTVAVLGCGIDQTYPREHDLLREKIERDGAVVTEFAPGVGPRREHFPRRNRIIAGLCPGLLVIEAGERSGVRITVRCALAQGRDVYAVPGPVDAALSIYPNRLIAEGAKLIADSRDILEEYGLGAKRDVAPRVEPDLGDAEKNLLGLLDKDNGLSADDLCRQSERPADAVLSALTELELLGLVERQADSRYVKIPR